jgi:DnaJ-class molecular chaperone
MEYKDYYKSLGVGKAASEKDIKSAYRKLARKYHPDVNPGDKAAEARFKEINEAHAVLMDPEKRKTYDTLGPDWAKRFQQGNQHGAGRQTYTYTGTAPGQETADFSDFFETLFGQRAEGDRGFDIGSIFGRGRNRQAAPAPQRGSDAEQAVDLTLGQAFEGVERAFTVQSSQVCPTCSGSGIVNGAACPTCHGIGSIPKTKRLEVKIPAGVRDGSRVRVAGEGSPGALGGPSGDLFLVVKVTPDTRFRRDSDNLHTDLFVPVTKLALGGEVSVPTLTGKVTMSIPAGSQNGRTMRLTGQGMPQLRTQKRGDLYVKLHALLPTKLDERQRDLFTQLEKAGA